MLKGLRTPEPTPYLTVVAVEVVLLFFCTEAYMSIYAHVWVCVHAYVCMCCVYVCTPLTICEEDVIPVSSYIALHFPPDLETGCLTHSEITASARLFVQKALEILLSPFLSSV